MTKHSGMIFNEISKLEKLENLGINIAKWELFNEENYNVA